MEVVETKDELRNAMKQNDKIVIVEGDLASGLRRMLKTAVLVSVAFVVVILAAMFIVGWSSSAGQTFRLAIHIAATIALLVGLPLACIAMRKGYFRNIRFEKGGQIVIERG